MRLLRRFFCKLLRLLQQSGAKVVDGATVDLDLDLGFSITLRQRVRLYGIDAPELRSKDPAEKAKGQAFVAQWFERTGAVLVRATNIAPSIRYPKDAESKAVVTYPLGGHVMQLPRDRHGRAAFSKSSLPINHTE